MSNKNISRDSLGDRMKEYENSTRYYLPKRNYILIRIDGKTFHSYTQGFDKPYDTDFSNLIIETTKYLFENIQGVRIGYCQSDEITLVISEQNNPLTTPWFNGNLQKICSISASMATAFFNKGIIGNKKLDKGMPIFDSRVWAISDPWEVYNCLLWRQQDATRNAIHGAARSLASHKECMNKNSSELQELIFQKGKNFNDYPTSFKRGVFVYKKDDTTIVDTECPIISQNKKYIFDRLEWYDFNSIIDEVNKEK